MVLDEAPPLPLALQLAVYRLAQELTQNVVKHAQARSATLEVDVLPGWVVLHVQDNGRGFDPAAPTAGIGLRTLRSRVALLGAPCSSAPRAARALPTKFDCQLLIPKACGQLAHPVKPGRQ